MNEYFQQIEEQLEELAFSKRVMLYFTIIITLISAPWFLVGESKFEEIEDKKIAIIALEKKFKSNSISSLTKGIKSSKKEVLVLEDKLTDIRFKNKFIQSKLESLGFIIFDEMGIAQILDDILRNSLENFIDIYKIDSQKINKKGKAHIVEKEDIEIVGAGSFKSIMALIQYIDSLNALLRIKKCSVTLDEETTLFKLNISHYGVEL